MTRASVVIDGTTQPLRQALREGLDSIQSFSKNSEASLKTIGGSVDFLRTQFGLLLSTMVGGSVMGFIKSQVDVMDALDETAQKTGLSVQALGEYSYAAKFASLDNDDLTKTFVKLSGTLQDAKDGQKEAVEIFSRFRLDPNNIKDADELLMTLADRFASMPDGVNKTALAVDMFGEKLGPRLLPLLADGSAGLAAMREEARQLGVVVDSETAAAAAKMNDELDRMRTMIDGVGMRIAQGLIPGLSSLLEMWVKNTKEAGLFSGTLATIGTRLKEGMGMDMLSKQQGNLRAMTGRMSVLVKEMERLNELAKEDPKAMLGATVGRDGHGAMLASERIKQLRQEYDQTAKAAAMLRAEVGKVVDSMPGGATPAAGSGSGGFMGPPEPPFVPGAKPTAKTPNKADPSQMAAMETMLAKEKQALIESGLIRQYEAEQELDFWKRKREMASLSAADRLAIERKVSALSYEVKRRELDRDAELNTLSRSQAEALSLSKLDTEMAASKVLLDNDMITKQQFLQIQLQHEADRYAIQVQAMQERMALMQLDPDVNPVELARIKGELLLIEQKYQRDRLQLMSEMNKAGAGPEGGLFGGLGAGFQGALTNMMTGAQTFAQGIGSIFASVRDNVIKNLISEPLAQYIAGLGRMLAVKLGFLTQEKMAQSTASGAIATIKGTETTAVSTANAVQAGTGAAASQAGIPIIGPMLALAAMAAVFAAVSGMGKKSARGGYDIPAGVNPLTQLHEEEMVLPKNIANPMRDLLASGGAGGGGGDNINVQVTAMDARGVAQFFRGAGGDAVLREMSMRRRSNRGG